MLGDAFDLHEVKAAEKIFEGAFQHLNKQAMVGTNYIKKRE